MQAHTNLWPALWGGFALWALYIAGMLYIVPFMRSRQDRDKQILALLTEIRDRLPPAQSSAAPSPDRPAPRPER